MIVERVRIDMQRWDDFMADVRPMLDAMPKEKREAFAAHWYSLQASGCVIAETVFHRGVVYCTPSDDFRRALTEFGVVVK